jgi:hypothetical protein
MKIKDLIHELNQFDLEDKVENIGEHPEEYEVVDVMMAKHEHRPLIIYFLIKKNVKG